MGLSLLQPATVSPAEWGAKVAYDSRAAGPLVRDKIIVHWGGTPVGIDTAAGVPEAEAGTLRAWERYHLSRGWSGIAYGYAIGNSGNVYRLRGWSDYGAHTGDLDRDGIAENREAIPVVFLVGQGQTVSEAALASFKSLRRYLCRHELRRLMAYGHREIRMISGTGIVTSCPGNQLQDHVILNRHDPAPVPWPGVTLRLRLVRTRSLHVATVQRWLASWGFVVAVDSVYGPETADTVRKFQRATGLAVDGVVGPATWAMLSL